nr:hypothetical protein [Tanacetum cinerariifolium]
HNAVIRTLTDVNINKLYQPWRAFVAIINKCQTGKSYGYDSLRLSQAQIFQTQKSKEEQWDVLSPIHKGYRSPVYVKGFFDSQEKQGVLNVPTDESEEELSWNSTDDEGDENKEKDHDGDEEDEGDDGEEGDDDDADQEVVRDDDKDDDEEGGGDEQESDEETKEEESLDPIPQTPENSEDEGNGEEELGLNIGMELIFETTSRMDVQTPTSVVPLHITTPTMTSSTIATTTTTSQAPILATTVPSDIIQNLPSFGLLFHFDDRLRALEEKFSEVMQTNQFAGAVSAIPEFVQHYMDQRMNEVVKVAVQIQSDWLRDEAQRENDEFLRTVDENINTIIKEQVKEQVKVQVSKILPRIKQDVNEQLEAKVLTRLSHSSRTSYAVAADLSEMELKKILIEKMKGNKSIQCSDKQRNLYKALVDAYESDKLILDTYGETRRKEGKEPESASAAIETATWSVNSSSQGSRSRQASASESALVEEPMQTTSQMEEPSHPEFDAGQQYLHNLLQPLPLIPNNRGRRVIPFEHFINNDLEYLRGGASSHKYTTSITKKKAADYGQIKWIEDLVPRTMLINEPIGYDKHVLWGRRVIAVTKLKIVEWHSYKHLDWITVRRDDDKLYKFKEGDLKGYASKTSKICCCFFYKASRLI